MSDFGAAIADAYGTSGPAIDAGRGVHDGAVVPEAVVKLPLAHDEPPRAGRGRDRHGQDQDAAGHGRAAVGGRACRCSSPT